MIVAFLHQIFKFSLINLVGVTKGVSLIRLKVSKMEPKTPIERPAEVLKCLIEMLISVANSKEKLLEIIEAGFGTRIFNKAKDKVVKKFTKNLNKNFFAELFKFVILPLNVPFSGFVSI